ncbi:hypothetical protein [Kribbella solani]|uniref:Uncharacterized protein n=1 Tax=Kribbella solani TaxID=236067 RepID=A0A841DEM8_9ACTN|nr:hypothetical protein [Kribbella solani]MBB5976952.1 hypothetical protein [Kribbella solani]
MFELRAGEQPFAGLELNFRARGNEQLVYTADQYPGVAVKVHWFDTKLILESLGAEAAAHWLDGTIGAAGRGALRSHGADMSRRLDNLRAAFGDGHSIPRSCGTIDFPFPGRVLRELGFPEAIDSEATYVIPAPVTVQDWRSLTGGRDLAIGKALPDRPSAADVTRMGQQWLEHSLPPGFEPELLTRLSPDSTVPEFITATRDHPELAASTRAFIDSARQYTHDTGELFALRGRDNLYFDAAGEFHLIDTLGRPAWQLSIGHVQDKLEWIKDHGEPPPGPGSLAPIVTTIASLNALADEVGTEPYWELPTDLRPYPWDTYHACINWQTDGLPHEQQTQAQRQAIAEATRARPTNPHRGNNRSI